MKMRIAFLLLVLCGCMACTPTVSNKAQNLLDKATSHYTKGEYHTAKILVDSIHTQFPREIALRKQARILDGRGVLGFGKRRSGGHGDLYIPCLDKHAGSDDILS